MGLFDRMGRVISSNFNALLDRAEDPRKSIEQTLSEMRDQVKAGHRELVRAVASEKQLARKLEKLDEEVEKWVKRAELAVRHDDDDLAKQALLQKRRLLGERDRAEALRAEQRAVALEMKQELERMDHKVEEVAAKKGTIVARAQQARAGGGVEALGAKGRESPFEDFRRMEGEIEGVEAAIAAEREIDQALKGSSPGGMSRDEVEAKFRALESGTAAPTAAAPEGDVDDELAALKRKVRIGT